MKVLVVVDMQNDFIDGSLGTPEAVAIVPNVIDKVKNFDGKVLFTRDTHYDNYMNTQEGKILPVPHCISGTHGWMIRTELNALRDTKVIDKNSFGSIELPKVLQEIDLKTNIDEITFVGLCTDVCVISNALMVKPYFPEVPIIVDASCCAGVTPKTHDNALDAMEACQIKVINR